MKQVVQHYRSESLNLAEVPAPQLRAGRVLIKSSYSLISAGTERAKIELAKRSLVGKARSRPDLVKKAMEKVKTDGLRKTWQSVSQHLNKPISLGYSSAGVVLEAAGDVVGLRRGDRVACGGEFANHAEILSVPKNLVVKVPDGVGLDHAAFATIGAIAMQSVRQAEAQLGERVAVIGLGLIGLLVVQILKVAGCQVVGIEINPRNLEMGKKLGCQEVILANEKSLLSKISTLTGGYGVDATIIAAGTESNRPIEMAGEITREKGRVVVLGAVRMDIPREPYYLKEIDLRLSRSYGPGRYDKNYEEKGHDYPFAYVRFTEQRNMHCFLELLRDKQIDLEPLITHRFPIDDAIHAYELLEGGNKEHYLGILLEYARDEYQIARHIEIRPKPQNGKIVVGVIGAGNYVTTHLLPHLQSNSAVCLGALCTATGMTAFQAGRTFGFQTIDSDAEKLISESDAILIATRHNDHASYALKALQKGKPIFVEKPLALNQEELDAIASVLSNGCNGAVMVGFNRRFSPAVEMLKAYFASTQGPKQILIRVNAGLIPQDHWIQDPEVGGGRLLGEACHFVDLIVALTEATITAVSAMAIPRPNHAPALWDDFCITLEMSDGSVGTIVYTSLGDTGFPKEYIEVFCGGRIGIINDFKSVELWLNGKRIRKKWLRQDKGQKRQMDSWISGLGKGESPIPVHEIINVHQVCLAAVRSIKNREMVRV
ncbi:MAG: bi-domain-containing oxidoreductase [bacterium]